MIINALINELIIPLVSFWFNYNTVGMQFKCNKNSSNKNYNMQCTSISVHIPLLKKGEGEGKCMLNSKSANGGQCPP